MCLVNCWGKTNLMVCLDNVHALLVCREMKKADKCWSMVRPHCPATCAWDCPIVVVVCPGHVGCQSSPSWTPACLPCRQSSSHSSLHKVGLRGLESGAGGCWIHPGPAPHRSFIVIVIVLASCRNRQGLVLDCSEEGIQCVLGAYLVIWTWGAKKHQHHLFKSAQQRSLGLNPVKIK